MSSNDAIQRNARRSEFHFELTYRFRLAVASGSLLLAAAFSGCDTSTNAVVNPLETEARDMAMADYKRHWIECGEAWFSHHGRPPTVYWAEELFDFVQQRGVSWRVESSAISEADRLNGFQWSGVVYFTATAYRFHFPDDPLLRNLRSNPILPAPTPGWASWSDRGYLPPTYHLQKQNGKWEMDRPLDTAPFGQGPRLLNAPKCEEVPK